MMQLEHPEKFDIEIAEKTLEQVLREPRGHDQRTPFSPGPGSTLCGSVGCIMGWASYFTHGYGVCMTHPFWKSLLDYDVLGLNRFEFGNIYGEMDHDSAIAKLKDYIAQAKAAQHTQDDYELLDEFTRELALV